MKVLSNIMEFALAAKDLLGQQAIQSHRIASVRMKNRWSGSLCLEVVYAIIVVATITIMMEMFSYAASHQASWSLYVLQKEDTP